MSEARELLEHIFVTAEERVSLFPADGYWISVRDTAALAIDALAQPEPAAREAALTDAGNELALVVNWLLDEKPSLDDAARAAYRLLRWNEAAADTSPAAAALLAQGEALAVIRTELLDMVDGNDSGLAEQIRDLILSLDVGDLAALAPGEET